MRVNDYLIQTFLSSVEGERLLDGFEALIYGADANDVADEEHDAEDADASNDTQSGGVASTECAGPDTAKRGPDSDGREDSTPQWDALVAVFRDALLRMRGAWPAIRRRAQLEPVPNDRSEARDLYLRLLAEGVSIIRADIDGQKRAILEIAPIAESEADDGPAEGADAEPVQNATDALGCIGGTAEGHKDWASSITEVSWGLHLCFPDWFAPFGFKCRFHQFEALCTEFGVPLPRPPGQLSYRERAEYYLVVNEALQEYRQRLGLDPAQFDAFLYGFAFGYVGVADTDELPPPRRAWLLLGTPTDDHAWLESTDDESISWWQGSEGIRPGDLCVMWVRSPHSCTHSVWRAISAGFADPFFFHYRTVWIGQPTRVPHVTFRELASDPVWREKPEIKAHLQGASGHEITAAEYAALMSLWEGKGFDTTSLPRPSQPTCASVDGIENERDVETELLEPLLRRLGITENEWIRQYPVRMGRGERVYPDYVLGLTGTRGEETARAIVEAKLSIAGERQLRDAYLQARSYGERLRVSTVVLCAVQGLWLFCRNDSGFSMDRAERFSWNELGDREASERLSVVLTRDTPPSGAKPRRRR